ERVMIAAFASAQLLVETEGGTLLSAVDPPSWAKAAAAPCTNTRGWPAPVGPPGAAKVGLCAPLILYDHAALAPASAGDTCDATEIDELLVLRTRQLTDDEKRQARATDSRVAAIIDRAEAVSDASIADMHGVTRDVVAGEMAPRAVIGSKVRLRAGI